MQGETGKKQIFGELEDRLSSLEPKDALKVGRDRWVIVVMLAGMVMTVPSILGATWWWVAWTTLIGLVVELCGLGVLAYRQVRDVAPEFIDAKRKFAAELDIHFLQHEKHLASLRSLPEDERDRRLAYLESRLDSLAQRYSLVFGAVDKLGFLPVLAGIFVQVQAIENISLLTWVLAAAIILLYGMALWMAGFRMQMQSYVRLLRAAG